MKSKFKRVLAFTASMAMCSMTLLNFPSGTFITAEAAAENPSEMYIGGTQYTNTSSTISGSGWSYSPASGDDLATLTLTGNISGTTDDSYKGSGIYVDGAIHIIVESGSSATVSTYDDPSGLTSNASHGIYVYDELIVTVEENASLKVLSADDYGIRGKYPTLNIDGTLVVESYLNCINDKSAYKGINISGTGNVSLTCTSDVSSEHDTKAVYVSNGTISISGVTMSVTSATNYAISTIYASAVTNITGGAKVNAVSPEGYAAIAGGTINIDGGSTVTASSIMPNSNGELNISGDATTVITDSVDGTVSQTGGLLVSDGNATVASEYTLTEALTIESGKTLSFINGGSITNPELLTVADDAVITVDGTEHIHNADGAVSYDYTDDSTHTKKTACTDCPVGYTTDESENHSGGTASCTEKAVCDNCEEAYGAYVHSLDDSGVCELCGKIAINETTFPDAVFRSYVAENFDTTGDGSLDAEEIAAVTEIDVPDMGISDLTGVEYFTALTELWCNSNQLTSLDVSKNTALEYLYCYSNQLWKLDLPENYSGTLDFDAEKTIPVTSKTLDLSAYGLDAADFSGGALDENGILTPDTIPGTVTYTYTLANGETMTVHAEFYVAINEENFPDAIFREYVDTNFDATNDDILTAEEIAAVTSIDVSKTEETPDEEKISSLKGIEYFTSLKYLYCDYNKLTSLDVSNCTALTYLYCYSNQLTSLDVSNCTALTHLYCYSNQLTSLDVSNNTALTLLDCEFNQLESLDVSNNTALKELWCRKNQLTSLDVSKNTALTHLYCSSNQLTSLDVSNNTALTTLWCHENQLTSLDVSNNTALTYLSCEYNQLTSIDLSANTALTDLYCNNNSYDIDLIGGTFNLSALPEGFDIDKASEWTNATVEGSTLTVSNPTAEITYTYDLGGGYTETFTLKPVSCTLTADMIQPIENQTYTGEEIEPDVILIVGNYTLIYDEDYTISYENNVNIGTASAVIKGTGNFWKGEVTVNFTIDPMDISDAEIVLENDLFVYNGEQHTAEILSVTVNGLTLTAEDYDIKGNTGTDTGTYTLIITGKGNFTGEASVTWEIGVVEINETNFPDEIFRNYVDENFDTTADDILTAEEIAAVTEIYVYEMGISDLTGVEYFTALESLECSCNNLTSLDVSNNTALKYLYCYNNQLTSLDVSNNTALTELRCYSNQLTSLDVSSNKELELLYCSSNQLTSLDVSNNTALTYLNCEYNQLTSLEVSKNTLLIELYCYSNQLTSLDVSKNTALTYLDCSSNQLENLDVSNNTALTYLGCFYNQLESLDVSNCTALIELYCYENKLTNLDVSNNTALTDMRCRDNQLTGLDVSQNTALEMLGCGGNLLIALDVSNNTALKYLYCYSNQLTSLDLSKNTALEYLACNDNSYDIDLIGGTFDLSKLPEGFDITKASDWSNAAVEGNILTVSDPTADITYTYDLGGGYTETFTLKPVSCTLTEDMIQPISNQTYTGEEIEPAVTVIVGNYTLVKDTDYTVAYENNVNAGTASVTITGTGIFTGNYTVEFEIEKAASMVATPVLTATYGDTLADVALPEGFTWQDDLTTSVGNAGKNTFMVTYTPDDTDNYVIVVDVEVAIEVAKAVPEVTPVIPEDEYTEGDALPEIGYESEISGIIEWLTELVNGLIEGENELEWQFTPDDEDNYEIVTGTAVVEAQATTTTTTTTELTTTSTETTTSSTSTSTSTETTTSSTSTSTSTETTTSSTSASTSTETTTSSTSTSTSTETTTSSTSTSTSTETTTTTTPPTTTTVAKGDADNDGDVDVADANKVLVYVNGTIDMFGSTAEEHEAIANAVDIDGDGAITKTDAALILDFTAEDTTWEELTSTLVPAADIDMTALNAKLTEAEAIANDGTYTEESYAALQEAIEAVKATQDAESLPSGYAEQMTNLLTNAIDGLEENLPQTGYSVVYNYIMLAAAAMVLFGIYAMAKSRKEQDAE